MSLGLFFILLFVFGVGLSGVLTHFGNMDSRAVEKGKDKRAIEPGLTADSGIKKGRHYRDALGRIEACVALDCSHNFHTYEVNHGKHNYEYDAKKWIEVQQKEFYRREQAVSNRKGKKDTWHVFTYHVGEYGERFRAIEPCTRWDDPTRCEVYHNANPEELWRIAGYGTARHDLLSFSKVAANAMNNTKATEFLNTVVGILEGSIKVPEPDSNYLSGNGEVAKQGTSDSSFKIEETSTLHENTEVKSDNTASKPSKTQTPKPDKKELDFEIVKKISKNPTDAINELKVDLGMLRCDVLWVMDNPSFFGDHSPVTNKLFELLGDWEDNNAKWDRPVQVAKASSIFEEFIGSKEKAEILGVDYLHGSTKKNIVKAASLARKSFSSEHDSEKAAFMGKVVEILAETPSVSIPKQAVRTVEKIARREIVYNV